MPRRMVLVIAFAVLTAAFLSMTIAQRAFNPNAIDENWYGTPIPPCFVDSHACFGHLLGTDNLGRDILSRLGAGGQITIGLSMIALMLELIVGITFGVLSRRGGDWLRYAIMRIGDAIMCFPPWPTLVAIVVLDRPPERFMMPAAATALLVGAFYSPAITRLIARGGRPQIIVRSIANQLGRDLSTIIVLLAMLDFLGYGVQPPLATWGNMLSDAQEDISIGWWAAVFPAMCIFGALLAVELVRRLWFATSGSREVDSNQAIPTMAEHAI